MIPTIRNTVFLVTVLSVIIGYGTATGDTGDQAGNITYQILQIEQQLERYPLAVNDTSGSAMSEAGFLASDETVDSQAGAMAANQIPKGGFIEFYPDKRTRVFTPEGSQISYAEDERSEIVTTPSGKALPATHIIGIPDGVVIHKRGNKGFVSIHGEVILTIIDSASDTASGTPDVPSTQAASWVEFAEGDPTFYLYQFHATWKIPHSPDIATPLNGVLYASKANILFNGIEPSDGSIILQPVTAFDYYEHSACGTELCKKQDPAILNKWTGSSWYCPGNNNYCTHTTPALGFAEGEVAQGEIYFTWQYFGWAVVLRNINRGTSTSYHTDVLEYPYLQSVRPVIAYEWGGSEEGGFTPEDRQKIGNAVFYGISVLNDYGLPIDLNWHKTINRNDHQATHGLDVLFSPSSFIPSRITLCTDCISPVVPLPGFTVLPTDPDGDGKYEDLNGSGGTDFPDLQIYFWNMDWISRNEPVPLFDYNSNGSIDFPDIQLLFAKV